jgi:hypothetical protein
MTRQMYYNRRVVKRGRVTDRGGTGNGCLDLLI